MSRQSSSRHMCICLWVCVLGVLWACPAVGQLDLGPEQIMQAGGSDIDVAGFSVPSFVDWDNDGLEDLVIGEGGGGITQARVRVYLNKGTSVEPQFSSYFFAQSAGSDLVVPGSG